MKQTEASDSLLGGKLGQILVVNSIVWVLALGVFLYFLPDFGLDAVEAAKMSLIAAGLTLFYPAVAAILFFFLRPKEKREFKFEVQLCK